MSYLPTRNSQDLESFVAYCKANPEQRFAQALRNWWRKHNEDAQFILIAKERVMGPRKPKEEYLKLRDTFYIESILRENS